MIVTMKKKEIELQYSFNSFKYMQDFDVKALDEIESKPFKIVPMLETLLMGAVNYSPKAKFTVGDVQEFLEIYVKEESITDLLEELMGLLQESSFFKSLQKKTQK